MPTLPTRACFWIIGVNNQEQTPAVAIDLHYQDGELAGETYTHPLKFGDGEEQARAIAEAYAATHGVIDLTYDNDTTEFCADC